METMIGVYPSGALIPLNYLPKNLLQIPSNLPSEIISNRPDIKASYNKLKSAKFNLDYANTTYKSFLDHLQVLWYNSSPF